MSGRHSLQESQSRGLQPPPRPPSVHGAATTNRPLALLFLQEKVRRRKGPHNRKETEEKSAGSRAVPG